MTGTTTISLLLLDDRELFREGFRLLLATQADFVVAGEAGALDEALQLTDTMRPDVIVLSDDAGGIGAATLTAELLKRAPSVKIVVLGTHGDDESVQRLLAVGARGVALKQQPSRQVFEALRQVASGRIYLAPALSHLSVWEPAARPRRHGASAGGGDVTAGPCHNLSRRERDVFELLVRGNTNRGIARLLGISPKTVETHRAHVLRKLGVHSIVDLVRFAARHQLRLD